MKIIWLGFHFNKEPGSVRTLIKIIWLGFHFDIEPFSVRTLIRWYGGIAC